MRPIRLRAPRRAAVPVFALLASLLALALGGCQSAPRPADGVAGAGSGSKVWKPPQSDSLGPTVAVVGSRRFTAHDIDSLVGLAPVNLREQFGDSAGYRRLVERAVAEEAVHQVARASGVQDDPEYKTEVERAAREILIRRYYQGKIAALPPPPDSVVAAHYEEHKEEYAISPRARVRHIQTGTRAKAESVRRQLMKGGLWDALCRANSTDAGTKQDGGILGFVTPSSDNVPGVGRAPAIVAAAFELKEGDVSQPLKSEKAWHLIRVEHVEPAGHQPLAAVRSRIVSQLASENEERYAQALLDSVRTATGATIFGDSIAVAILPARTPRDFFAQAQAAGSPMERIALYRALVKRFPQDSVTVQAEFMIGFTYAEDLGDSSRARDEFEKFIERHPNHDLAASARWMIENLDKPGIELDDVDPDGAGGLGAPRDTTGAGTHRGD